MQHQVRATICGYQQHPVGQRQTPSAVRPALFGDAVGHDVGQSAEMHLGQAREFRDP